MGRTVRSAGDASPVKSGTNQPHGSAFLHHNDASANAKSWITPPGERNPKRIVNQFGGTLGSPIKRDKLFFFVSFEGTRDRLHDAKIASISTVCQAVEATWNAGGPCLSLPRRKSHAGG